MEYLPLIIPIFFVYFIWVRFFNGRPLSEMICFYGYEYTAVGNVLDKSLNVKFTVYQLKGKNGQKMMGLKRVDSFDSTKTFYYKFTQDEYLAMANTIRNNFNEF
jgi:hypothetical protein